MSLRAGLVIVLAIALPLICISLVLILVNAQSSDRLRDNSPRPVREQPQPISH